MAQRTLLGLNILNQLLRIPCGPQSRVGIGVSGTWTGTLTVYRSFDGANYLNFPATDLALFPQTPQNAATITANGNFWIDSLGAQQVVVSFTTVTSGTALVIGASAVDGSWQDAFLASTSKFVSQNITGGLTNSQVIAAQTNRAWHCRYASVSFNVAPSADVEFQILDGASSVLWDGYIPANVSGGAAAGTYTIPLPVPDPSVPNSGGVTGTPGNSMTLKLFAPGGSVISTVNGELLAA
jgi:hypothetical protein